MMSFNPKEHMTKLSGKDYLEVKWRIYWFRDENPNGLIDTELLHYEDGFALVKASVYIDDSMVATGTANADSRKKKAMWSGKEVMKAETAAIGRALAHAGYGTQFTGENEGEFLADSPVEQNGNTPEVLWPSRDSVNWVMDAFVKGGLSNKEIFELAGVTALNDGDGWRKYPTPQAAVDAIQAAFDNATSDGSNDNQEMSATFHYMSYVGSKGTLQFMANEPGTEHNTCALLFEGRGGITEMYGSDELYHQLNLGQYDTIKNKNTVSDFIKMKIPVDFHFVNVTPKGNGEQYLKITAIKGDPVIPF